MTWRVSGVGVCFNKYHLILAVCCFICNFEVYSLLGKGESLKSKAFLIILHSFQYCKVFHESTKTFGYFHNNNNQLSRTII